MWKWMKNTSAHALSAVIVLVFAGQASAGANADAMLSLALIPTGGAGNQRDDGVTTGRVSGRGTTIAIEVFATGVTTPLVGMQIVFDFDASLLTFVKAENSAFSFPPIPGRARARTSHQIPLSPWRRRGFWHARNLPRLRMSRAENFPLALRR